MRLTIAVVVALAALACGRQTVEDAPHVWPRVAAIGDTRELPLALRRALSPAGFKLPRYPGPDDWMTSNHEPAQTFDQYVQSSPNRPDSIRHVIYLLPLGDLPPDRSPALGDIAEVVEAFYTLEVRILPPVPLTEVIAQQRINSDTGKPQLYTPDILRWLPAHVPDDAYGLIAATMVDLYPDPTWNYVFGSMAVVGVSGRRRSGRA